MSEAVKENKRPTGLTANQKLMLRLSQFRNRVVRLVLVIDGQGRAEVAVVEDMGKAERFG